MSAFFLLLLCAFAVRLEAGTNVTQLPEVTLNVTDPPEVTVNATEPQEVTTTESDTDNSTSFVFPIDDPRHCLQDKGNKLLVLRVLPGHGWDNLQSRPVIDIFQFNYSECQLSSDKMLVIPDGMTAEVHKSTEEQPTAYVFKNVQEYYPPGTKSLTQDQNLPENATISSSFSDDYQKTKTEQILNNAITVRVLYQDVRYDVAFGSEVLFLSDEFKAAVSDIADSFSSNDTSVTQYYADSLVGKFGTHYINALTVGGMVNKEDGLKTTLINAGEKVEDELLKLAAKTIFSRQLQGQNKTDDKKLEDLITKYQSSMVSSSTTAFGGVVEESLQLENWTASVGDRLSPVNRFGSLISDVITAENFPNISLTVVEEVKKEIKVAVNRYYFHNTHFGCTDRTSPNYVFKANEDDGTCEGPATNYTFGGMYQTCKTRDGSKDTENGCRKYERANPVTGDMSCPQNYNLVQLYVRIARLDVRRCEEQCDILGFDCSTICHLDPVDYIYELYWCAAQKQVSPGSGAAFGGLYSSKRVNPVTGGTNCPEHFIALQLGDMHVCISVGPKEAQYNGVPFGGFYSSMTGNPLVEYDNIAWRPTDWDHRCPTGYSRHIASIDRLSSDVYYCIAAGNIKDQTLPVLVKPPYTDKPNIDPTAEKLVVFVDEENSIIWYRASVNDQWKNATTLEELKAVGLEGLAHFLNSDLNPTTTPDPGNNTPTTPSASTGGLSGGAIAGIVVGVLALVAAAGGAAYYYGKKRKQSSPRQRTDSRSNLTASDSAHRSYSSSQRSNEPTPSQSGGNVNDAEHSPA